MTYINDGLLHYMMALVTRKNQTDLFHRSIVTPADVCRNTQGTSDGSHNAGLLLQAGPQCQPHEQDAQGTEAKLKKIELGNQQER